MEKFFLCLFIIVFLCVGSGYSQVEYGVNLDVQGGVENGTIQLVSEPQLDISELLKMFDGNQFTGCNYLEGDTFKLTLIFDNDVNLGKIYLYPWMNGKYSVEVASDLTDLDQGTGSYQVIVNEREFTAFVEDSISFSPVTLGAVRITWYGSGIGSVLIGELSLFMVVEMVKLKISPDPVRLLPGTSLELEVKMQDVNGNLFPYVLDRVVIWSVDDPSVAVIDERGKITGVNTGNTVVTATAGEISGVAQVYVLEEFHSEPAGTLHMKIAVVLQDPVIDSTNNRRVHDVWRWTDPMVYINQIVEEFSVISHGVVDYEIVEIHDDDNIFTMIDGKRMSISDAQYYFLTPGKLYGRTNPGTLQYMAEVEGRVRFDYKGMCDTYNFGEKRNRNEITEVWVYSFPFSGMYESQLIGPGAFWCNSPPITNYDKLEKLLPVMGWNYERGVAEALHSYGHRVESVMVHRYGRWDCKNPDPNSWEIFTRIDKDVPDGAHVGNIHFPPNGLSDYDYSNTKYVKCYADNWKRYPVLLDQRRDLNCREWGCSQLGYMRWWFSHLPHFKGKYKGVLNNWWFYAVDYDSAITYEAEVQEGIAYNDQLGIRDFKLYQNYPNPFNRSTVIEFYLPICSYIELNVYDILGRRVMNLFGHNLSSGRHTVNLNLNSLPSGVYIYELKSGNRALHKKMLLIK